MPEFLRTAIQKTISTDSSILPEMTSGNEIEKFKALSEAFQGNSPLNNAFDRLAKSVDSYTKSPLPSGQAPQPAPEETSRNRNSPSLSR